MAGTILVVDDERNIVELVRLYLQNDGFQVITAGTGTAALEQVREHHPDLIVLDLMLPELDGIEVCRRLRQTSNLPIIMLTARSDDVDKIVGLEVGADDYVTKPFNPRELVARVRAILRRTRQSSTEGMQEPVIPATVLQRGNVVMDLDRREVTIAGNPVELRSKEFDLLKTFLQNEGIALDRDRLLNLVWGYDFYGDTRTIDVHITHLREKLQGSSLHIQTIWGIGYKLVTQKGTPGAKGNKRGEQPA